VSPIQILTKSANDLSSSIDRWNRGYLILVLLTVILAGLTFIAQAVVIMKSKKLSGLQGDIIRAKDAELTTDLRSKDLNIAKAQQGAAEANRKAEEERLARVKIELASRARMLPFDFVLNPHEELKTFAGTNVIIETLPEFEPRQIAGQIVVMLHSSGWNAPGDPTVRTDVNTAAYLIDFSSPGVWLEMSEPTSDGPFTVYAPSERLESARDALMKILNDNGIVARERLALLLPHETVRVVVALRPGQGEDGAEYGTHREH